MTFIKDIQILHLIFIRVHLCLSVVLFANVRTHKDQFSIGVASYIPRSFFILCSSFIYPSSSVSIRGSLKVTS